MSTPATSEKKRKRHSESGHNESSKKKKDTDTRNGITPSKSKNPNPPYVNPSGSKKKKDEQSNTNGTASHESDKSKSKDSSNNTPVSKKSENTKSDRNPSSAAKETNNRSEHTPSQNQKQVSAGVSESAPKKPPRPSFIAPESLFKVRKIAVEDEHAPVIAHSSAIRLPAKAKFTPYIRHHPSQDTSDSQNTTTVNPTKRRKPSDFLLRADKAHKTLSYTAVSHETPEPTPRDHYIAIYDPKTKSIELAAARAMTVSSTLREEDKARKEETEEALKGNSNLTQVQNLSLVFGSARAKKIINEKTVNQQLVGDLAKAAKEAAKAKNDPAKKAILGQISTSSQAMPSMDQRTAEAEAAKPRPPYDKDTTDPMEVYTSDMIVGPEILKALRVKPWVQAIQNEEEVTLNTAFCANRLKGLVDRNDIKGVKTLRYMLLLMKLYWNSSEPKGKKGGQRHLPNEEKLAKKLELDDSETLNTIVNRFSDGDRIMTTFHVHLLISTLLALSLVVDGGVSDTHDLMVQDLNLKTSDTSKFSKEIGVRLTNPNKNEQQRMGIKVAQSIEHRIAKIRLPLEFPKEKTGPSTRK